VQERKIMIGKKKQGQDSQKKTVRGGRRNRATRTGRLEEDSQQTKSRTGQQEGHPGLGHPEKDSQNINARI
jgi:hypothetical protein